MRSFPIAVLKTSPPTMARARDPSTSVASSPPLSSSLAFHCHSFSHIRKSSDLALVLCLSLVAGTLAVIRLLPGFLLAIITHSTQHAVSYMGLLWRMPQLSSKTILNLSDPYSCFFSGCIISYVIELNSIIACKTPYRQSQQFSYRFDSIHVSKERNYRVLSSPTVAFSVADPTFVTRAAALIARASTWT